MESTTKASWQKSQDEDFVSIPYLPFNTTPGRVCLAQHCCTTEMIRRVFGVGMRLSWCRPVLSAGLQKQLAKTRTT